MARLLANPCELLAARLRRMLWVERRLSEEVLPGLLDQAHAIDLRYGLERHLLETEGHVATLRDILHELGAPAEPEESPALKGLVREHEQLLGQLPEDDALLGDLAHAEAAATTEHVEMAAYESLARLAEALGEEAIGIRLREVMEQEELALELIERARAKLLAEKVESERL
jgi:ferritin-like metal-binding protein YciE